MCGRSITDLVSISRTAEIQDLTARSRHRTDCRLLACLLTTVVLMSSSGASLVTIYIVYRGQDLSIIALIIALHHSFLDSVEIIKPLVLVGAVLLGASCLVLCCILEVMVR